MVSRRLKKVLVVSFSALLRQALTELARNNARLELCGVCADAASALKHYDISRPDVIILGLESPHLDWRQFISRLPAGAPPIIGVMTAGGSDHNDYLCKGVVDLLALPAINIRQHFIEQRDSIETTICAAARSRRLPLLSLNDQPRLSPDTILLPASAVELARLPALGPLVVVGASTGGCEALTIFIGGLPPGAPPVAVVIHMPAGYTDSFARRLNSISLVNVAEAKSGARLVSGSVLIAPGGKHLLIQRDYAGLYVEVIDGPLVGRHRPSVDVLYRSAVRAAGRATIGVILTGMGSDGARCLLEIRKAGGRTIGQDRDSCVVYGMPMEADKLGAVMELKPLGAIAAEVMKLANEKH